MKFLFKTFYILSIVKLNQRYVWMLWFAMRQIINLPYFVSIAKGEPIYLDFGASEISHRCLSVLTVVLPVFC